jgi:pimeloyl-ACP methyl ester carboxylesterase
MTSANLGILGLALALALHASAALAAPTVPLTPCRLQGVEAGALCGRIARPLDPARPDGTQIDLHFAVLPALARNKKPDPVFFFAGGPGQSAIGLAGVVAGLTARLGNRRDVVLVDQRGTGLSAPLKCEQPPPAAPLRELSDPARQFDELRRCRAALERLPYGDLRQFTTTVAMADVDAVRRALGAERIDLIGGSYGTRAALEYQRQFPQAVRRVVLDGVAPPDMALPAAFSTDGQAAFDALARACAAAPACDRPYPALQAAWRRVLATLPREVTVPHPVTGQPERFTLSADVAAGLLRLPLYVPALASALPLAITQADGGRFDALVGLSTALGGERRGPAALAEGMHYSVMCAEDAPRLAQAADPPGPDFGDGFARQYEAACADWPRGAVAEAFYTVPPAPAAALVLSGGADPVTPPRHGERVARALGALARHVVVPEAGHGVMSLGCMPDVIYRFIDADTDAQALQVDAGCVADLPRPPAFQPVRAGGAP